MIDNLNFIYPEIFISLSIMFLLLLGVFKKNSTSFSVDLIFKNNLSKGLKYASEKKATHAVIIGEKEISQENIIIKDLKKRTQKKIQLLDLSVGLRNYLFNVKK